MIAIYVVCLLLLVFYFYRKHYTFWSSRDVPFETPFLIFGSFYNVVARKQHMFHRIRDIYNKFDTPYVGIYIFNQPNLVIRSPELIKKILVKDFDKFLNRQIASNEAVDPIAAHSMFSAKDQMWKNLRAKISPVFTSGKMKLMFPLMKECATDLVDYLGKRNSENIDVKNVIKKFAVDNISSCAFGINAYCLKNENSEILKIATKLANFESFVRNFSIFSFFFAPKLVDLFRLTFLDKPSSDYLLNVFNATLQERKKKNILRHDLIDLLNNLNQLGTSSDGYTLDDVQMAAQALTFFSAGNDTTSLTVTYALYELALNKTIQSRLRKEVTEVFEKYGDFTYETIQEMYYLDMVLNETLRKYPLTIFLNRESLTEYKFEETGFTLEKGVSLTIPVAGLHFDPEYFPDPESFDPERFSKENKHKIIPFTFLPFGDGPRNCIGQRFGILVSKVALAYVIKDFILDNSKLTSEPLHFDPGAVFLSNKDKIVLKISKV